MASSGEPSTSGKKSSGTSDPSPEPDKRPYHLPFTPEKYKKDGMRPQPLYEMPKVRPVGTFSSPSSSDEDEAATAGAIPAFDLVGKHYLDNPIFIFGEAFSGKTCLMLQLAAKSSQINGKKHWLRFVDMQDWIQLFCCPTLHKQRGPKTFLEMLSMHLQMGEKQLREIFRPLPNAKELLRRKQYDKMIRGDLFLDGFDEVPHVIRDYVLRLILAIKLRRSDCPIRIWISSRNHVRAKLINAFGLQSAFEIVPFRREKQMEHLYFIWRNHFPTLNEEKEKRLWKFTRRIYKELEHEIRDFTDTLGATPLILEIITSILMENVLALVGSDVPQLSSCIMMVEVLELIAFSLVQYYCLKAKHVRYDPKMVEPEFLRFEIILAKYAVQTFPTYEFDSINCFVKVFDENGDTKWIRNRGLLRLEEDMFRVGFLREDDNGMLSFANKAWGDMFLGLFYSRQECLETNDPMLDSFFTRVLLMDTEAKGARMFFDAFVYMRDKFRPKLLKDFLVTHYKLGAQDEAEWEKLRDDGNIWHLVVAEGFNTTARLIRDALCPDHQKRFFQMRVPMEIHEGSGYEFQEVSELSATPIRHVLSCASVLALFGHHALIREHMVLFMDLYGVDEVRKEFAKQGSWTPLHYAAMHSNLWFFHQVLADPEVSLQLDIPPGIRTPEGKEPMHLLTNHSWFHTLHIKDNCIPDCHDRCEALVPAAAGPTPDLCVRISVTGKLGGARRHTTGGKKAKYGITAVSCAGVRKFAGVGAPPPILNAEGGTHFRKVRGYRNLVKELSSDLDYRMLKQGLRCCLDLLVGLCGDDVNAVEEHTGSTLLHHFVRDGDLDNVMHLIQLGARVDIADAQKMTPLHLAGLHGHREIFVCLTKFGAKPLERSADRESPFQLWRNSGASFDQNSGEPMTAEEESFFNLCQQMEERLELRIAAAKQLEKVEAQICAHIAKLMKEKGQLPESDPDTADEPSEDAEHQPSSSRTLHLRQVLEPPNPDSPEGTEGSTKWVVWWTGSKGVQRVTIPDDGSNDIQPASTDESATESESSSGEESREPTPIPEKNDQTEEQGEEEAHCSHTVAVLVLDKMSTTEDEASDSDTNTNTVELS